MIKKNFYFSNIHFEFCVRLIYKILDFNQPTSTIISFYFKSKGKKFGSTEREFITDLSFSIVRNKNYFESIIINEKNILPDLEYFRCLVILGCIHTLGKNSMNLILSSSEKKFLESVDLKSIQDIFKEFRKSNDLNEKISVPSWIFNDWVTQRGLKQTINFVESNHIGFPIYCRVNPLRIKIKEAIDRIEKSNFFVEQSNIVKESLKFLPGENLNQVMSLFSVGEIEVQDLGSQLIAKLVAPKRHSLIIDFCAGTGGKSLALGAKMKNTGKIFALDISASRILKLKERVAESKLRNIWPIVIKDLDDQRLLNFNAKADAVLVDAPCSGLGTLRRNPDLKWRVHPEEIEALRKIQIKILNKASLLCKIGGYLVYATCSTICDENERIIEEFLSRNIGFSRCDNNMVLEKQNIFLDKSWNVFDSYGNIQLWSDLTDTDSFFMTRLIRKQ